MRALCVNDDTMRDGPPSDDESSTMASETLLREISALRSKLRDLEEDGRSSICESFIEGDAALILKKEVVKLADEKAKQEKEFMNQMSSLAIENQNVIANLKSKLARSRAVQEELEDHVEAITNAHAAEVERLTENLTRADEEIVEARQEIDYLQHENEDLRTEKEEIAEEREVLRLELENERRRTDSYRNQHKKSDEAAQKLRIDVSAKEKVIEELREQIGEMNDSMLELEEQNGRVQNQLKHQAREERNKSIYHSIFSAERESLERSCEQLEERLQRSQARLAEKDATIETLTNSLKEERSTCRKIRKELKEERDIGSESKNETVNGLSRSLHGTRDTNKELELLRRRNKLLNDEVRELRKNVSLEYPSKEERGESQSETSKFGVTLHPINSPPRSKKSTNTSTSPGTAVSGLVASFENRIHRRVDEKREDNWNSGASDLSPSSDKSVELREARRTIQQLEVELQEEREMVVDLRKQLVWVKVGGESLDSVERKLEQSHKQVERLQRKVEALEKEREQYRGEIEQLQHDASIAKNIAALQEEKKDEERDEELTRLRSQVGALQSELNNALDQVEELNDEISKLQASLEKERRVREDLKLQIESTEKQSAQTESLQKKHSAEINKLEVELMNAQLAKDSLQTDLTKRIEELEAEYETMELVANEEIEEVKSQLSSLQQIIQGKDDQINRLEKEKNQLCSNMSMASNAKNGEFEELQSELIDKTAKNTAQSREIQALNMKIEELESVKRGKAEWLQSRVDELEQELKKLKAVNKKSGSWEDIERLRRENLQLKEATRDLKMERRNLQDRIEALVGERSSSKSVHILRERNATLKDEVEKLTRRLKKMEESITRFAI